MRLHPLFALLALSCASAPSGSPGPATVLPPAQEGMAPTPYTAEQIRWSHPVGASVTYRHEAGGKAFYTQMQWIAVDDETCSIAQDTNADRAGLAPGQASGSTTWEELRDHASFPADATTITREEHHTDAGDFDCWKYVVRGDDGSVSTFWFDTESAGSPVDFLTTSNGEVAQRMELVEADRRPLR